MKKIICVTIIALLTMSSNIISAQAQSYNKHDSKGQEQSSDHLMLSFFNEQIHNAVANYYKDDSIHVQYNWWDKNYDVVEVDQTEKGHVLKSPFVVKFTVLPSNKKSQLGTDTITFGVTTGIKANETKINLLSYDHKSLKSK